MRKIIISFLIASTMFSCADLELIEPQQEIIDIISDADLDGIDDLGDNCPQAYNPLQMDRNSNGIGDSCDPISITIHTDILAKNSDGVIIGGRGLFTFPIEPTIKITAVKIEYIINSENNTIIVSSLQIDLYGDDLVIRTDSIGPLPIPLDLPEFITLKIGRFFIKTLDEEIYSYATVNKSFYIQDILLITEINDGMIESYCNMIFDMRYNYNQKQIRSVIENYEYLGRYQTFIQIDDREFPIDISIEGLINFDLTFFIQ
jgi:hypothetical protein